MSDLVMDLGKICVVGTAAEVVLPWALLGLSNYFLFNIPPWSLWLVFGGPPLMASLTFLGDVLLQAASKRRRQGIQKLKLTKHLPGRRR